MVCDALALMVCLVMGRMLKNPRHERFAKLYVVHTANGGNATDAYKQVYKGATGFNVAPTLACRLLKNPKVQSRIMEMRMDIKRKSEITFEKILTDYQQALEMAKAKDDPGNVIAAAREQAKLVGLLIDRKEVGSAGDFERMESIADILSAVAEQAGPEAALALSQAFNLMGPTVIVQKPSQEQESEVSLLEADPGSDAVN